MRSFLALAFALTGAVAAAQKPVTPAYLANRSNLIYPARWMMWVGDHHLLLADESERGGVYDLDAATGKTKHVGDTSELKKAGGPATKTLNTPDAVDPSGRHLGYSFEEGFFLLDATSNQFSKLSSVPTGAEEFHFSPDGASLLYVKANNLYIADIASDTSKQLTTNGREDLLNGTMTWVYWEEIFDHDSNATWWSPDSKQIAFFETDESPVPRTSYVNYDTQYPQTTTQCYPKPGNANPIVRLMLADPATGAITSIPKVENQEYIVGVKWAEPDKLLFETMNREQTEARFNLFEPSTRTLRTIVLDKGNWINVETDFDIIDGGKSFLFTSAKSGFRHFYKVPIDGGDPIPLTSGKWMVVSNVEGPNAMEHLDKANGRILFTCTKDSFLERQVYSVNTDGTNLKKMTQGFGYHYVLVSKDGKYFTDEYSNIRLPATTKLLSINGKELRVVDKAHTELAKEVYQSPLKIISIPARDGFALPAIIRMPRHQVKGKRYPVIMRIYGGPESPMISARWSFSWASDQMFADNGFIVLSVDCRSATFLGPYAAAIRGHFYAAHERDDFVDAARWIKKQPYADPNRLGVCGWSGGGGNTLNLLCHTKEFKAGVAGAPFVDPMFYDTFYSEQLFGLPKDNASGYRDAAVWRYAKDLHGKLLLIWGTGDDNVQQQQELAFVNACIEAGKQIDTKLFPNRGHGFGDLAAQQYMLQALLDFFKANL